MALRHSQVYEASANIRGGMSIYADILAQRVPEYQFTRDKITISLIVNTLISS